MIYRIRFDIHYSLDGGAVGNNFHFECQRLSVGIHDTNKFLKCIDNSTANRWATAVNVTGP